jgi:hypothetical protein
LIWAPTAATRCQRSRLEPALDRSAADFRRPFHHDEASALKADPFKTDPDGISVIKVSETWVAGEKAFG